MFICLLTFLSNVLHLAAFLHGKCSKLGETETSTLHQSFKELPDSSKQTNTIFFFFKRDLLWSLWGITHWECVCSHWKYGLLSSIKHSPSKKAKTDTINFVRILEDDRCFIAKTTKKNAESRKRQL